MHKFVGVLDNPQNPVQMVTTSQHNATLLGTTQCMRLATVLRHVATCCNMLRHVGSSLKMVKFEPTTPNMSRHGGQNTCNMLRPTLQYAAMACCDCLAGA